MNVEADMKVHLSSVKSNNKEIWKNVNYATLLSNLFGGMVENTDISHERHFLNILFLN